VESTKEDWLISVPSIPKIEIEIQPSKTDMLKTARLTVKKVFA